MADRDLLEAAARAAGMETMWEQPLGSKVGWLRARMPGEIAFPRWSPLSDDAQAFRLAVQLRIDLHTTPIGGEAVLVTAKRRMRSDLLRQTNPMQAAEPFGPDPYAATRRAIVRAAAAIAAHQTGDANG